MCGIMHDPELDGLSAKELIVPDLDKLLTLEGKRLDVFINELPTVNLTPGKANDVVTNELYNWHENDDGENYKIIIIIMNNCVFIQIT